MRFGLFFLLLLAATATGEEGSSDKQKVVMRCAWLPEPPYQFEEVKPGGEVLLTGFDVEVARAAFRRAVMQAVFEELGWEEALAEVKSGEVDFALGASDEASRRDSARFTVPYRASSSSASSGR